MTQTYTTPTCPKGGQETKTSLKTSRGEASHESIVPISTHPCPIQLTSHLCPILTIKARIRNRLGNYRKRTDSSIRPYTLFPSNLSTWRLIKLSSRGRMNSFKLRPYIGRTSTIKCTPMRTKIIQPNNSKGSCKRIKSTMRSAFQTRWRS